ncbi:MAG: FUSC family protein [Bacillota bacterium]
MEENILSKIISRTLLCLSLILVCAVGAIAAEYTVVVPFAFTAIYGFSYIFWKANNGKFPYYFHMALLFLIASNKDGGVESVVGIVTWGLIITLIILAISFVKLRKNQMPMFSRDNVIQGMMHKYKTFFNENSHIMTKLLAHCLIVFLVSWIAYFVYDHRGYWIIVSASAVLIGGEYGRISARGKRRIVGAFVSAIVVGGLVFFDANTAVLVCVAVATFFGIKFFMPEKYIMGSACIGMNATVCNILASGDLSYDIVIQRVLWTILGAILALALCWILDKVIPSLYQNYTKEKLIVARK